MNYEIMIYHGIYYGTKFIVFFDRQTLTTSALHYLYMKMFLKVPGFSILSSLNVIFRHGIEGKIAVQILLLKNSMGMEAWCR